MGSQAGPKSHLESPYTAAAEKLAPLPRTAVEMQPTFSFEWLQHPKLRLDLCIFYTCVAWVGQLHHPRHSLRAPAGLCRSLQKQTTEAIAPRADAVPGENRVDWRGL